MAVRDAAGPCELCHGYAVAQLPAKAPAASQRAKLAEPMHKALAMPPALPAGTDGPWTSWITDPDGYRIELVQWPTGHADGITETDFL